MKELNRTTVPSAKLPTERIIQFGEGNFLRAFVDWIVARMNRDAAFDAGVVVVKPRPGGSLAALNDQQGLYHVNLVGLDDGTPAEVTELVDVITRAINPYDDFEAYLALADNPDIRFIVSNTTEAGIEFDPSCSFSDAPARSFPGKLVQLLYRRFTTFGGDPSKTLTILPCELIFRNGDSLRRCINSYIDLWGLGAPFRAWVDSCMICNTLVDRIVSGYPAQRADAITEKTGFSDRLLVSGELFHLWVIEAPASLSEIFPADRVGLNVMIVDDETPYHEMKVALLNAPHTALAPTAFLSGLDTVREAVADDTVGAFIRHIIFSELLPTVNLPEAEKQAFAQAVISRFSNPLIRHELSSIMLNSIAKYKARDLPALHRYHELTGRLPQGLVLGLAAIITFYRDGARGLQPNDNPDAIAAVRRHCHAADNITVARNILSDKSLWDEDLSQIAGLPDMLASLLDSIARNGITATVRSVL